MITFKEYIEKRNYEEVKAMIFNVLDPTNDTLDIENEEILMQPLSTFKNKDKILTEPELSDMINNHGNRGDIIKAIHDGDVTIQQLMVMILAD